MKQVIKSINFTAVVNCCYLITVKWCEEKELLLPPSELFNLGLNNTATCLSLSYFSSWLNEGHQSSCAHGKKQQKWPWMCFSQWASLIVDRCLDFTHISTSTTTTPLPHPIPKESVWRLVWVFFSFYVFVCFSFFPAPSLKSWIVKAHIIKLNLLLFSLLWNRPFWICWQIPYTAAASGHESIINVIIILLIALAA